MVIINNPLSLLDSDPLVFDFQPQDPEDLYTAVVALSGRKVPGVVLKRKIKRLPEKNCWFVGYSQMDNAAEAVEKFNGNWETDLQIGYHDCRNYADGLVEYLTGNCVRSYLPEKQKESTSGRINAPQKPKHENFVKVMVAGVLAAAVALSPLLCSPVVEAAEIKKGATLFGRSCIGCHDGGGNIIMPGSTLFLKDLQRNGVDTEDKIYQVTYSGKGRMPGFGEKCTPRGQCTFGPRLQDDEIKLLAEFVKLQADLGWPSIDRSED